jgi:VCBS repeat-containing protein
LEQNTSLTIAAPGVLGNDRDPEGDLLTAIIASQPTRGVLALNTNGAFVYTPATNFNGVDSFTYRASDGQLSSGLATVQLTVNGTNDAPIAVDDAYTLEQNTSLTIAAPGVLGNDSDPEGDVLTAIIASQPTRGVLALNTNGGFVYTPATNFNGVDSFTYRASDGQLTSALATVNLQVTPVNQPPDTNNWSGNQFTTLEDVRLNAVAPGVLAGITDPEGDVLTATLVTTTARGTLTLNSDGSFTYLAATNYFGVDSFAFRVSDGRIESAPLEVAIIVTPVNDAPSFAKGENFRLPLNAGPQVSPGWATEISPGPTNESSQTVSFVVTSDNPGLFAVAPAVAPDGTLTFTPAADQNGKATVSVVAQDNGGTVNGGVDRSAPQEFIIAVNVAPTVQIVSPTNGAFYFQPADFTVLAEAVDTDGTVAQVQFFQDTNLVAVVTNEPFFTVRTNLPAGSYTFTAVATDNEGATGTSDPVTVNVLARPPLQLVTSVYYNPQNDLFEQRVRVFNPTDSLVNAIRVLVYNLTNVPAITVANASGSTNGVQFVQTFSSVAPGSSVDLTIEFFSPNRVKPNPVLVAELVPPSEPPGPGVGTYQPIPLYRVLANKSFLLGFPSISNRVYSVEYSSDLVNWKTSTPALVGDGNFVPWIDTGIPKTESNPAQTPIRFYRLLLLP